MRWGGKDVNRQIAAVQFGGGRGEVGRRFGKSGSVSCDSSALLGSGASTPHTTSPTGRRVWSRDRSDGDNRAHHQLRDSGALRRDLGRGLVGFDRRDELVAPLRKRAYVAWRLGRISEGGANLRDAEVQPAIEVNESIASPDGLP